MRPVVELKGRIVQVRDVRARRQRRLPRDLDGASGRRASRSSRSAMPTATCAPRGACRRPARRGGDRRRPALPHRRPHLHGSHRPRRDRRCRSDAARRGDYVTLIGGGIERRRSRRRERHHRLRGADPSRPALSPGVEELTGLRRMARADDARTFVCQNCGAVYRPLAGQVRFLRRVEHDRRGKQRVAIARAGPGRPARKGRLFALEPLAGETQRGPAARRPASPSSTASPAAASCAARCCWSAAIPASASRRC